MLFLQLPPLHDTAAQANVQALKQIFPTPSYIYSYTG